MIHFGCVIEEMAQNDILIEAIKKTKKIRKALIIGSGGVGKTSILSYLSKHITQSISDTYQRTLFINFDTVKIINDKQQLIGQVQVQDLAGQITLPIHALKDFVTQTIGATDLIFLVFDNNNFQSFLDLQMWIGHINAGLKLLKTQINPMIVLIRNKIDLEQVVDDQIVNKLMEFDERIIHYYSVSCTKGIGFESLQSFLKEVFA